MTRRIHHLATAAATLALAALGAGAAPALAADAPVTLRLSHFLPPAHPMHAAFEAWVASLGAASDGSIGVTIFPAEQLGKTFDHYDMARDGIADVALVGPGYQPGRFPVIGLADLPFLYNGGLAGTAAVNDWYGAYAPAELKDVHFCMAFIQEPATLHTRDRVEVPADLQGVKLRSPSATMSNFVTSLGGANVAAPVQQTRELIDRGTVDGTFVPWGSANLFGIDKVARFHLDMQMNAWTGMVVMNKARYEGLPAGQRAAIDANCSTAAAVTLATPWVTFEAAGKEQMRADPEQQIVELTDGQKAAWREAGAALLPVWRESVAATGIDADAALAAFRASLERNGAAY